MHYSIAAYDAVILHCIHLADINPQHCSEELVAQSCEVVDVNEEGAPIIVVIEGVDTSIRHGLRLCWTQITQADIIDRVFQTDSLRTIRNALHTPQPFAKRTLKRTSRLFENLEIVAIWRREPIRMSLLQ